MTVSQLGEWRIIEFLQRIIFRTRICNDDVSIVSLSRDRLAVLKVDMLVNKTDMPPGMSFRQVGRKALVMSISDFAAKGIRPTTALIALGIHADLKKRDLENIALGLKDASEKYGLSILGGDTNESSDLIIASILFGTCQKGDVVFRYGAKPGDLLITSEKFGLTNSGLKLLIEKRITSPIIRRKILNSVYRPEARLDFGLKLRRLGATSSIDSSDGLALSLHQLSKSSRVGFLVKNIPIAKEAKIFAEMNDLDPFELAFYGGEEYEIIATVNPKIYMKAKANLKKDVKIIGEAIRDKTITYIEGKSERKIEPKGWEHFRHT